MTDRQSTASQPCRVDPHFTEIDEEHGHRHSGALSGLIVGAIGIVYGDIGTSPIYAFRETFAGHHRISPDPLHIFGVLSLVFWSMIIVVLVKYVAIIMRADNKGEGGSLALLALINRSIGTSKKWTAPIILLGVFATALFYGDSMITPAMSVLSATEGLKYVAPGLDRFIVPIAVGILVALFFIQSRGTAKVGLFFGPIMLAYFTALAALGIYHIVDYPQIVLEMINPWNAVRFFMVDQMRAFVAMGAVVLSITGAEALYADMGHFGRRPIALSWSFFVLPCLVLNYMGQGAMVLSNPAMAHEVIKDPFFLMVPEIVRTPVVVLAILATIIASQAVISGAFSLTQQAIQLGFLPRMRIQHTSASAIGQIYIPTVNWGLMVMVLILVLFFRSSSNLAAAYGIAVTGAMFIDTCLLAVVLFALWRWPLMLSIPLLAVFFLVDIAYLGANLMKVPDGGWVPLVMGLFIFTMLTTWSRGRHLMQARMAETAMPIPVFIESASVSASRVKGTAVFMTSTPKGVPHALLHNLKHNRVLHERIILLTVKIMDVPHVDQAKQTTIEDLGHGFMRMVVRYGFMQEADVPAALAYALGKDFRMMDTSFFLSRQTLIASDRPGMSLWREKLFAWMMRNAESAMEFFRLPTNRVVELGSQVEI